MIFLLGRRREEISPSRLITALRFVREHVAVRAQASIRFIRCSRFRMVSTETGAQVLSEGLKPNVSYIKVFGLEAQIYPESQTAKIST